MTATFSDIRLRPWGVDDLPILERLLGDPGMTVHLGGPESPAKLRWRHKSYLEAGPEIGRMFVIVLGPEEQEVGSVGYWPLEWQGGIVWESGWSVLPDFQGRGIGSRAAVLAAELARLDAPRRTIHAFPSIDNAASNASCRKAGFTLRGETEFEYPVGNHIRCNDWVLETTGDGSDHDRI